MRINHNISALNAYRNLATNNINTSKSLEKLSSGLRINRASDDAAGLAISEKMRSQIRGLQMAERNALDGISLIQTAEGALSTSHEVIQRMRELAVQAANDTYTDTDRAEIQKEINQLTSEVNRISNSSEYNTAVLLNGSRINSFNPDAMSFTDGKNSFMDLNTGITLNVVDGGSSLAAGQHTATVSATPAGAAFDDGSTSYTFTPANSDITSTGTGTYSFSGDVISYDLSAGNPAPQVGETITLEYVQADNNFKITNSGTPQINDTYTIGSTYNEHGLTFNMDAANGFVDGEKLTFTIDSATGSANTKQVGFEAGKTNSMTFTKPMTIDSNVGTGSWTITKEATGFKVEFTGNDKNGNPVTDADTMGTNDLYQAHGLSFQVDTVTMADGDTIKFDTVQANPTYDFTLNIDGTTQTIATKVQGTGTPGSVTSGAFILGNTSFNGLSIDAANLTEGQFQFEIVQSGTGEDNSLNMQIGANAGQTVSLEINDMRATALNISTAAEGGGEKTVTLLNGNPQKVWYTTIKDITDGISNAATQYAVDVTSHEKAQAAVSIFDDAIQKVSSERARLGAIQNRLEHTVSNLKIMSENVTSSESRIRDLDMALEMSTFTKNNILNQAAQAMLSQANQMPQGVLQLLK